jgi:hypothetical protein
MKARHPREGKAKPRSRSRCEPGDAGYWAERTLLDFLLATVEG